MEDASTLGDSVSGVSSDSPTLSEMIDLALGTPEVGAVNFNILRLVLHDLVQQLGMDNLVVNLDDFNLNQVEKYRNYIDGNAQSTPMPMVLRVNQQNGGGFQNIPGGSGRQDGRMRTTPRSGRDDSRSRSHHGGAGVSSGNQLDPNQPGNSGGRGPGSINPHLSKADTNIPTDGSSVGEDRSGRGRDRGRDRDRDRDRSRRNLHKGGGGGGMAESIMGDLTTEERVDRLEKNLEVLYQMPGNPLISTATGMEGQQGAAGQSGIAGAAGAAAGGANVNDMWQIIQLNNRVASCESAIQKMATLIEDLALDQNQLRGDTHDVRNNAESLMKSHSKMSMEFSPLNDRCTLVQEALDDLREDLAVIKDEWKAELNQVFDGNFDKLPSSLQQKLRLRPGEGKEADAAADFDYDKNHGKFPKSFKKMTPNTIPHFPVAELTQMDIEEINAIPKSILYYMTPDQKDAIDRRQAENRPKPNLNVMRPDEIKQLNIGDLEKLTPADISNIKPSKFVFLKPEVRKRFDEIRNPSANDRQSTKHLNLYSIPPQSIAGIPLSQLEQLTPSEAANLDDEILHNMTHEQRKLVKEIARHTPPKSFPGLDPEVLDPSVISRLPPAELQRMSEAQLKRLTIDQMNAMTVEQRDVVDRMKTENERHSRERKGGHHGRSDSPLSDEDRRGRSKNRDKRGHKDGRECSRDTRDTDMSFSQGQSHSRERHTPVDVIKGKITRPENLTPISKEETIDLVQDELQKQYVRLQEQQKKLADDIQNKMELVYEKLFKEIVTNDHNLPYMAVGEPPEAILGPGVCTLAGMPPGVAVCQFPEADGKNGHVKSTQHDTKVCPGVGLCPASDNCPNCNAYAQTMGRSGPGQVLPPPRKSTREPDDPEFPSDLPPGESVLDTHYRRGTADQEAGTAEGNRRSQSISAGRKSKSPSIGHRPSQMQRASQVPKHLQDLLLQEMRSLVLIDLEKIREEMKAKEVSVFDESDILERLDTIWEAIKIIKSNEETLAVKILKQDAFLSKLPKDTIDRIHRIPAENLDAIASATWDKPMMLPHGSIGTIGGFGRQSLAKDNKLAKLPPKYQVGASSTAIGTKGNNTSPSNFALAMPKTTDGSGGVGSQEIANLYNNLSNLIAETTEHKMKIEELGDQVKIMEAGMVTKILLQDVMSDKADKGDVNTKVSYDEFGRAIDDLSTNLKDLVNESFNNSEHWKQVTDNLAQDVNDKMDKAELAPLKTYFKSNIKALDERVRQLQLTMEEPDPAGTRKKLLRDYNCISCDRKCNISGITNAPTLPLLGPIAAGHTSASRRAFDLHRMRIKKKIEQTCRDLPMMERQLKCLGLLNTDGSLRNDSELHKVNRFQGGSHTAVTASARIRASHRLSSLAKAVASPTPNNEEEEEEEVEEIFLAASLHNVEMYGEGEYEEEMEEMSQPEPTIMEVVAAEADEGLLEEMEGEGYEEQPPKKSSLKVLPEPEMISAEEMEMEQAFAYAEE